MILVNALGVIDSGGIVVLDKFLCECLEYPLGRRYLIIANDNFNIGSYLASIKKTPYLIC